MAAMFECVMWVGLSVVGVRWTCFYLLVLFSAVLHHLLTISLALQASVRSLAPQERGARGGALVRTTGEGESAVDSGAGPIRRAVGAKWWFQTRRNSASASS